MNENTLQKLITEDFYDLVFNAKLGMNETPIAYNHAVDVGTSKTRGLNFILQPDAVNPDDIIRIPNKYSILSQNDVIEALKLEFDKLSFQNLMLVKLQNLTNSSSFLYGEPKFIAKGMTADKLLKTSNYSISNISKFKQINEYVINAYFSVISTIYANIIKSLKDNKPTLAERYLNVHVNLACMLPDEERNSVQAQNLLDSLKGVIEYELPLFGGLKGRMVINNTANQRLDLYGEAESVIYYYIIKNKTPEIIEAFTQHSVAVGDMGEGSFDVVFFKERELITKASSTSRTVNGSTLVSRVVSNIERRTHEEGSIFTPSEDTVKRVLEENAEQLIIKTSKRNYNIADALNDVKSEMSSEIANVFKVALEKNSALGGVDNLFLIILAGRTMSDNPTSPTLGNYIASQLEKQLDIPAEICKVTHPDSNILGAALKMLMALNR